MGKKLKKDKQQYFKKLCRRKERNLLKLIDIKINVIPIVLRSEFEELTSC